MIQISIRIGNNKADEVIFFLFLFTKVNKYVIFVYKLSNTMTPEAERFNGWAAMLGFVAAVGAYVTTGQIIPGWF